MNIISKIIYWLSVIAVASLAIIAWVFIGWQIGLAGIIAIFTFLISYSLSGKFAISRRDRYTRSEWGVFCKKMTWAWGTALITYGVAYIIISYYFGDVIDVMPK